MIATANMIYFQWCAFMIVLYIGPSHFYRDAMALSAPDAGVTFTRGELASLSRIGDGVAAFWIKRGLLIAEGDGAGRGTHRRFGRMQVSIAAILGELQKFGINIGALTKFADLLQRSVTVGESLDASYSDIWVASRLAVDIVSFNNGSPRIIYPDDCPEGRPAQNIEELESALSWGHDDLQGHYIAIAKRLEPNDFDPANLYVALGEEMDKPHHGEGAIMLLWQVGDEWRFDLSTHSGGFARNDAVSSALYLDISSIVHRTWSIDRAALEDLFEQRRAERLSSRGAHHAG